jgi:hypothetical protein
MRSAEDPVSSFPGRTPSGKTAFVDLRANPYDFDAIPEAEQHPPLMQALRALNATRSPVFTAKCDAWPLESEELEHLQLNLDLPAAEAPAGFRQLHRPGLARALSLSLRSTSMSRYCAGSRASPHLWIITPQLSIACCDPHWWIWTALRKDSQSAYMSRRWASMRRMRYRSGAPRLPTVVALVRSKDFAR